MTLPFAVIVAVIAAVLETSVLAELPLLGATVNLVLVSAVVATIVLGVVDGIVLAFVGGLIIDMLTPGRPLGAATLAMLLDAGHRDRRRPNRGPGRRVVAIGLVLILTAVFHVLFATIMVVTAETPFAIDLAVVLISAVLNALVAVPLAALFGAIERRFGETERADW